MNADLEGSSRFDLASFLNRTLTGIVFVTIVGLSLFVQKLLFLFAILMSGMALIGTWEYYAIARRKGLFPLPVFGLVFTAAILVDAWFYRFEFLIPILIGSVLLGLLVHLFRMSYQGAVSDTAINMFGVWYVGLPMALMVYMAKYVTDGQYFVAFLLAIVWMTDTGAYVVGKNFGRTKITPRLSPNKTLAGTLGGLVTALLVGVLIWVFWDKFSSDLFPSLTRILVLAGALGVIAQIGDLAESALKRDADIKDSGTTFTAHGGILDIIDSLLFCAPVLYLYVFWFFPLLMPVR